ncbi:M20/M25/M40 family metallo-hydrolase [Sphaerisporangium corydalis]|uniref:M20/M25/M40 family metallo-hydrolase n=1 Tax=Sphaerisporangium corydalis TaxID=1441875 RepID=A0ABV9ESN5_9ACTN|nr:M20/M25/M40 family metallo-hydrolase [Sphaerisporangium corydalis]
MSTESFPHLVLVGARPEIVGKLVGAPIALTLVDRPGADDPFVRTAALRTFTAGITDTESLLACVRAIHRWRPVDAMLGLTEFALYPTSLAGEALGIRVNPAEAVRLTRDKAAMRHRLAERGLSTTAYRLCAGIDDLRAFVSTCRGKVLVKPADGNGGRGISLIDGETTLEAAWAHTARECAAGQVLAEEFIEGHEISVETMSAAGEHRVLAVTEKHTTGPPHFVETSHELPATLGDLERKNATAAVFWALDAVGHAWGPGHTEVITYGDGATVVEINTRYGGARIWEMVEFVSGVDLATASARALLHGLLPAVPEVPLAAAGVRFLTPPAGRIIAVTGLQDALGVRGVVRIGEMSRLGEVLAPLTDYRGRAGYVLAGGRDPESAAAAASRAASLIRFQTVASAGEETSMSDDLRAALAEVLPSVRRDLEELIRIPSVSADPAHSEDVRRSAELTARLFDDAGAPDTEILDDVEGGRPAVVARFPAPPGMPTVLLYAHHDVQPTGDPGKWTSPPFTPLERDGRLYGRGSADDKAGIAAHLAVLRLFGGRPPVGVTVFVEGEEEIGSPTLGAFLRRHRDKLRADVAVLADSANLDVGVPSLTTTLRGLVDCVVEVRALERGVHSGVFGGAAPDALTALCRLLATLHDDQGEVAVEGLVVGKASEAGYSEERFRAEAGMLDGVRLLGSGTIAERIWAKPTATVLAIDATPVADASNTLAPSARAKVSVRLAPGQNVDAAWESLARHLRDHAPWGVQVELTRGSLGRPYAIDTRGAGFDAARVAFGAAYGKDLVEVGIGGTIPFIAEFADAFPDAAILVTSAGSDPDARVHGADESLHLGDFANACLAETLLLVELARANDRSRPPRPI